MLMRARGECRVSENSASRPAPSFRREILRGIAAAGDLANEDAIRSGGAATTNLHSPWLAELCSVCGHTFRIGDRVQVEAGGMARHCSPELPCDEGGKNMEPDPEVEGFFQGLNDAWPPRHPVQVHRLEAGHELLMTPRGSARRRTCAVCGHTFRRNDHVVICPCNPDAPKCRTAVHRDVVRGLLCYDSWDPGANGLKFCPVTMIELDEEKI
jgi:hypothetical protein